jgi:hypothetical protein
LGIRPRRAAPPRRDPWFFCDLMGFRDLMSGSSPAARVGKSKVVDRAVQRFCPGF